MKTILFIGYVWPEPKSSAAGSHMMSFIRLFKNAGWRVIFSTPAQKTEFCCDLIDEDIEVKEITVNCTSFDQFIEELAPDAVLFDRFLIEEQFGWRVAKHCPSAIKLLDTEDLQCLRGARQDAHKKGVQFDINDLHTDLAKREIASIYRCDLSLIISSFEMELLLQHFLIDSNLLIHIPFMLDNMLFDAKKPSYKERKNFVTIGNLRHAPNWDSVLFLQTIWPKIRKQLPDAELHIYGAYTPPKATALNNEKIGFLIKDRADDVNQVMTDARVCLSPLRFGAGIKGKFVDAMLNKLPIVTTSIGSEGMMDKAMDESAWPGFVADTEDALIANALSLYNNEELWNEKMEHGAQLLKSVYDGKRIGLKLLERVEVMQNNLSTHRNNNFIGSMLNYHSMRSTEFMARWIEEKNKIQPT